jgi:PAS domain S-box-containing protein
MEEALRESRESFSRIFRLSPVASAVSEWNDGRYLDVNEAFVQTTGFAREEVLGRTSVELGIWRGHGLRAHLVAELDEIQVFSNREFTFRRKDGQIRQGLFSAAAVDFGGRKCLLSWWWTSPSARPWRRNCAGPRRRPRPPAWPRASFWPT